MIACTAPGKIILFGEHAVVYGQPALAVPVHDVQAVATVRDGPLNSGLVIQALDINLRLSLAEATANALSLTARLVLDKVQVTEPDAQITIRSTIPVAAGLGSGAAVSAALGRALAEYLGSPLSDDDLSDLVYEVEKLHHGTPSGIDNTVICYRQPVFFVRGHPPEIFEPETPFHILIADTGIATPTRVTVGAVRALWEQDREAYEAIFTEIGQIARSARQMIESGDVFQLGPLMNRNQSLLRDIHVSSPELERLIEAARNAGAYGAKLSGGGRGGNMIALVAPDSVEPVSDALERAGAVRVLHTVVR